MTQHFHFWVHNQRKLNLNLEEISVATCSLHHYQQWPRYRNNSNASGWVSDENRVHLCSRILLSLSVQFSSVVQSCRTFCNPRNRSTPGLPVYHQLPEFIQTHVHRVSDAIQPSHPLSSASPPAPNPSQHQSLFQWVNSSHEVAKVLEFQL